MDSIAYDEKVMVAVGEQGSDTSVGEAVDE